MTGNAAADRLGAEIGAEFGAAAFGEDGVAVVEQRVEVGQLHLHRPGSRNVTWSARREGSIMIAETGVITSGMRTRCLVSMPSFAICARMKPLDVSLASPMGPQNETRPPSRAIPIAAFSALPPQISARWPAFAL